MESLLEWLSGLNHWQIDLLVAGLLLQGAVFTVFPEEVIITSMGVMWSQGRVSFIEALFAVQLGMLPANAFWVFMGAKFGRKLLDKRPFSWLFSSQAVDRASARILKIGLWVAVVTRFTPLVRGPVYFSLGLSGIPLRRFMPVDGVTSFFQISALLYVGYRLGQDSASLLEAYQKIAVVFGALILGGLVYGISRKNKASKRNAE